jgi:organic radical activating enzyme
MNDEKGKMKSFRVNEIFYSLQGEGRNTGRAAIFIRFAGCNLRCSFCDTEFDSYREMTTDDIITAIAPYPARFVVLTGGEPTLQADEAFVDQLHQHGYEVAMESNGTRPAPRNLDWLTISPKPAHITNVTHLPHDTHFPHEIKIIFDGITNPEDLLSLFSPFPPKKPLLYLQPCDTGDAERNAHILHLCIEYIKQHPCWRLSLQTHKLTGIK